MFALKTESAIERSIDMALFSAQIEGLGIKNPSLTASGGLQSNGESYTTTKPSIVIGGVFYSTSGSSYASISSEGGGGFLFYPSPGNTAIGIRIVPSGTTITLALASGAKGSVTIYDLDGFFTNL